MREGRMIALWVSGVCFLICGIISICCYYPGYVNKTLVNQSLVATDSYIKAHYFVTTTCSRCCSYSNGKCTSTCSYTCYDHWLTFQYTPDAERCLNNGTQTSSLFMRNDGSPAWGDATYSVGATVTIQVNVCAFGPLLYADQQVCDEHGNVTPIFLSLFNSQAMWNSTIAFFVFVCICAAVFLVALLPTLLELCGACVQGISDAMPTYRPRSRPQQFEVSAAPLNTLSTPHAVPAVYSIPYPGPETLPMPPVPALLPSYSEAQLPNVPTVYGSKTEQLYT